MQAVILCGGKGTRAYPQTREVPKALMQIAGMAIVERVMRIYAADGFHEFVLSCGYLKEAIMDHFSHPRGDWDVVCVDTGEDADTGDRVWNLRHHLRSSFHVTYCDGLGDVDISSLQDFHVSHGDLATVTAVPLRSQYGILHSDGDGRVVGFEEKPILAEYWVNGGFFVFDGRVFDHWQGHNLEREVLPELAKHGHLHLYRHRGFWRSMDTYKDQQELDKVWPAYAASVARTFSREVR